MLYELITFIYCIPISTFALLLACFIGEEIICIVLFRREALCMIFRILNGVSTVCILYI